MLSDGEGRLFLALFGLVFAGIGGGIIGHGGWTAKQAADLLQNGQRVQGTFKAVELNESLEVNGANPYRIVAQWLGARTNQVHVYRSANLWFDPSEHIRGESIPVYVDLQKPKRHHMDTSFLLERGN